MSVPPHAPYADVTVGEEVLVRVFVRDEEPNTLTCECVFREDTFGGQADLSGLLGLERMTHVDQLITGVCSLVWNELLGTPVFHEDDEEWWSRVENAHPWTYMQRRPENGWVDADAVADRIVADADAAAVEEQRREAERAATPAAERDLPEERDEVAATLGDADVADLKLSQEEMALLMRGEVPEDLVGRLLKARSTENLLESVAQTLRALDAESPTPGVERALNELAEVQSRFKPS